MNHNDNLLSATSLRNDNISLKHSENCGSNTVKYRLETNDHWNTGSYYAETSTCHCHY